MARCAGMPCCEATACANKPVIGLVKGGRGVVKGAIEKRPVGFGANGSDIGRWDIKDVMRSLDVENKKSSRCEDGFRNLQRKRLYQLLDVSAMIIRGRI